MTVFSQLYDWAGKTSLGQMLNTIGLAGLFGKGSSDDVARPTIVLGSWEEVKQESAYKLAEPAPEFLAAKVGRQLKGLWHAWTSAPAKKVLEQEKFYKSSLVVHKLAVLQKFIASPESISINEVDRALKIFEDIVSRESKAFAASPQFNGFLSVLESLIIANVPEGGEWRNDNLNLIRSKAVDLYADVARKTRQCNRAGCFLKQALPVRGQGKAWSERAYPIMRALAELPYLPAAHKIVNAAREDHGDLELAGRARLEAGKALLKMGQLGTGRALLAEARYAILPSSEVKLLLESALTAVVRVEDFVDGVVVKRVDKVPIADNWSAISEWTDAHLICDRLRAAVLSEEQSAKLDALERRLSALQKEGLLQRPAEEPEFYGYLRS